MSWVGFEQLCIPLSYPNSLLIILKFSVLRVAADFSSNILNDTVAQGLCLVLVPNSNVYGNHLQKNSRLAFLISLISVSSMQNAVFGFNTSVTFMPLAFLGMGFCTVWKCCVYIIFGLLIHYYSGYSPILAFSLQFLLFRENGQFASWLSHNILRFCVLLLFYVTAALFMFLHTPLHSVPEKGLWISLSFTSRFLYVYSAAHLSYTGMLDLWPADNSTSADPIL